MNRRQRMARRKRLNAAQKARQRRVVEDMSDSLDAAYALSAMGLKIPTSGLLWTPQGFITGE